MNCQKCGAPIQPNAEFCNNCGERFNVQQNYAGQQGYGQQQGNYAQPTGQPPYQGRIQEAIIRKPVTCILLSIVTCGIYMLYWDWITNKQINALAGREVISSGMVVLGWFCAPVMWYIWYKWDLGLQDIARMYNKNYSSNFVLWLILLIVAGVGNFVMLFQVQDTLNRVYGEQ